MDNEEYHNHNTGRTPEEGRPPRRSQRARRGIYSTYRHMPPGGCRPPRTTGHSGRRNGNGGSVERAIAAARRTAVGGVVDCGGVFTGDGHRRTAGHRSGRRRERRRAGSGHSAARSEFVELNGLLVVFWRIWGWEIGIQGGCSFSL